MTKGLPARYAKFITAVVGQGLVFAQYEYGAGNKWVTLATACAGGALGVLAVPNAPKAAAAQAPAAP